MEQSWVFLVPLDMVTMPLGNAKFQPSVMIVVYSLPGATSIEGDRLGRREFGISPAGDNMVSV